MNLLLTNIGILATPIGTTARKGDAQGEISTTNNAVIIIKNKKIVYVGSCNSTKEACSGNLINLPIALDDTTRVIDCGGKLVTPGLVDSHTHLIFGGWRQKELGLKLAGVPYLDILKSGGGILNTVKHTRTASESELFEKGEKLLNEMLSLGVTTCEAKSGYGLSTEEELKQLRVINELNNKQHVDLVSTFMGAHAVPNEYADNRSEYIDLIINEMIPAVATEKLAEFCDVFCESSVFTPQESLRILTEAKKYGMTPKMHAD
ncbi:MAG: amidohydrolase family protein, partial [Oscillospiraceae bacterium]|nr:amidohydrolase family protein [Oscillospiraceae bacterium]